MSQAHSPPDAEPSRGGSWLASWAPEDAGFWEREGRRRAWTTLAITTASLSMAFIAWFLVSAMVVRLPQIGFKFTPGQLF